MAGRKVAPCHTYTDIVMNSARQYPRPFEATLGHEADRFTDRDESGLHLRRDWGEAGHRLDDEPSEGVETEQGLDLLLSLYSEGGWDEDATIVSDPIALDAPASEELELTIDVELPSIEVELPEPSVDVAPIALEAAVAPQSESHLWEGFDGELGVFVATYRAHVIGAPTRLTLHLTHERSVTVMATVRFVRAAGEGWPGVGVQIDQPTDDLRQAFRRFGRLRPAAFYG